MAAVPVGVSMRGATVRIARVHPVSVTICDVTETPGDNAEDEEGEEGGQRESPVWHEERRGMLLSGSDSKQNHFHLRSAGATYSVANAFTNLS